MGCRGRGYFLFPCFSNVEASLLQRLSLPWGFSPSTAATLAVASYQTVPTEARRSRPCTNAHRSATDPRALPTTPRSKIHRADSASESVHANARCAPAWLADTPALSLSPDTPAPMAHTRSPASASPTASVAAVDGEKPQGRESRWSRLASTLLKQGKRKYPLPLHPIPSPGCKERKKVSGMCP